MNRRTLAAACLALAGLALYAFRFGAEWGSQYAPAYGSFTLSHGELALRLNLLLLVLPAAALLAAAAALAAPERVLARFDGLPGSRRRAWDAGLAAWLLLATFGLRVAVLHSTEITDDENVYELQARILETGHLSAPSLPGPDRAFLDNQFVVNDGHRYGVYFIGQPAVLAAARLAGLEDWSGAVAAALTGLLALAIARRTFGERAAALTAALLAVSPFFLCVSATHLSQPTSTLALTVLVYALLRLEESPARARWWAAAAAGVVGGFLTRPQTAAAFALVCAGPIAWALVRGRLRTSAAAVASGAGVALAGLALFLWVNAARSGAPLRSGYAAYLAQGHPWGFPVGFSYSLRQLEQAVGHLGFWLFGWPVSLAFVPFFRRTPHGWRLLGTVVAVMVSYAATGVPTVAHVGPVYYAECIPLLAILTASGIEQAVAFARATFPAAGEQLAAGLAAAPVALTVAGLVTFVPVQLAGLSATTTLTRLPYDVAAAQGLDRAVVFVRGKMPASSFPPGSWAYFHRNADPALADPVLWVRDLGPERNRTFAAALGRRAYALALREGKLVLEPAAEAPPPSLAPAPAATR